MIERKLGKQVIRVAHLASGKTIYLMQINKRLYYSFWLLSTYRLVADIGHQAPQQLALSLAK